MQTKEVNELSADDIQSTVKLIKIWKNDMIIVSIYTIDKRNTSICKKDNFQELDNWLTLLRVIKTRKI